MARSNSNFLAVGSDVLGPGLWVVGDSVFPGQGTLATVLSAIRAVERMSGVSWPAMQAGRRVAKDGDWRAKTPSGPAGCIALALHPN